MKKTDLATMVATRSRVLPLLERFGARPALLILVYHRINKPEGWQYDTDLIEATPEVFDDQMRMLRRRHDVADPEEMLDLINHPQKIKRLRVAITFDDGYYDNYTTAFPILKAHGLGATFFLPTDYIGSKLLPWWDRIAYAIRQTTLSTLVFDYPATTSVTVNREHPEITTRAVLKIFKGKTENELDKFLAAVAKATGVELPTEAEDRQFLSWDEALEMQSAGMGIGSHTNSHRILAQISESEQQDECSKSREILQSKKLKGDSLAYPVGGPTAFSQTTMDCTQRAGYRGAFSNYGGLNFPDQMRAFDVKRMGMDIDETVQRLRTRLALSAVAKRQVW